MRSTDMRNAITGIGTPEVGLNYAGDGNRILRARCSIVTLVKYSFLGCLYKNSIAEHIRR